MQDIDALEKQLQEARRDFTALLEEIRPELHRYCARMAGSIIDGEDLVQDVLAQAFFKLSQYRQGMPLRPWLFSIAHNRCIDFLRARRVTETLDEFGNEAAVEPEDPAESIQQTAAALALLLDRLPPRERSCVLLKDMMGYSVDEIAELTATTASAVKSALHRGRAKLTGLPPVSTIQPATDPNPLLQEYVRRFNARDWDAATELLAQDARLQVVGVHDSDGADTVRDKYMHNYDTAETPWWFEIVAIDGREAVLCWRFRDESWRAGSICTVELSDNNQVHTIRDYIPAHYLLTEAAVPKPPDRRGQAVPADLPLTAIP